MIRKMIEGYEGLVGKAIGEDRRVRILEDQIKKARERAAERIRIMKEIKRSGEALAGPCGSKEGSEAFDEMLGCFMMVRTLNRRISETRAEVRSEWERRHWAISGVIRRLRRWAQMKSN